MALFVFIFLLMLLAGIRLSFYLSAGLKQARLRVEVGLLFGVIRINANVTACWFPLALYINGKPQPMQKKKRGRKALPMGSIMDGVRLVEVKAELGAGIKDDGAKSVLLAGILREAIWEAGALLKAERLSVSARPVFTHGTFWMELEGIARIYPVQIIHGAIGRKISKMRKEKLHNASC